MRIADLILDIWAHRHGACIWSIKIWCESIYVYVCDDIIKENESSYGQMNAHTAFLFIFYLSLIPSSLLCTNTHIKIYVLIPSTALILIFVFRVFKSSPCPFFHPVIISFLFAFHRTNLTLPTHLTLFIYFL